MPHALNVCNQPGCPELVAAGGRCAAHRQQYEQQRGCRHQRGYDSTHEQTRRRLLPAAYGQPCPRCHKPMLPGQDLDLGHSIPLRIDPTSRADRIEHASCNRGARD